MVKKIDKKPRILDFLKKNGRSSASKIAYFIRADIWTARKYLTELKKENKVKEEVESVATYWSLR